MPAVDERFQEYAEQPALSGSLRVLADLPIADDDDGYAPGDGDVGTPGEDGTYPYDDDTYGDDEPYEDGDYVPPEDEDYVPPEDEYVPPEEEEYVAPVPDEEDYVPPDDVDYDPDEDEDEEVYEDPVVEDPVVDPDPVEPDPAEDEEEVYEDDDDDEEEVDDYDEEDEEDMDDDDVDYYDEEEEEMYEDEEEEEEDELTEEVIQDYDAPEEEEEDEEPPEVFDITDPDALVEDPDTGIVLEVDEPTEADEDETAAPVVDLQESPAGTPVGTDAEVVMDADADEDAVGLLAPMEALPATDPPVLEIEPEELEDVEVLVSTAQELIDAMLTGAEQIKLVNHVDLRTTAALLTAQLENFDDDQMAASPPLESILEFSSRRLMELPASLTDSAELNALPTVLPTTQSITGDCTDAAAPVNPGSFELAPLTANEEGLTQCVIFTPSDLFRVEGTQQLWLDNLYMRIARNPAADDQDVLPSLLALGGNNAEVWITNVAFQSDGMSARGIAQDEPSSKLYAGGAGFYSFGPSMPAVVSRGFTTLEGCTFSSNEIDETGAIPTLPLVYGSPSATIVLQSCTFSQNDGRDDLGQASADDEVFFSDDPRTATIVVEAADGTLTSTTQRVATGTLADIPQDRRSQLLTPNDAFLREAEADAANSRDIPITQIVSSASTSSGGSDALSMPVISAIVAAAVVALLLALLVVFFVARRRNATASRTKSSGKSTTTSKFGTVPLTGHRSYGPGNSSNASTSRDVHSHSSHPQQATSNVGSWAMLPRFNNSKTGSAAMRSHSPSAAKPFLAADRSNSNGSGGTASSQLQQSQNGAQPASVATGSMAGAANIGNSPQIARWPSAQSPVTQSSASRSANGGTAVDSSAAGMTAAGGGQGTSHGTGGNWVLGVLQNAPSGDSSSYAGDTQATGTSEGVSAGGFGWMPKGQAGGRVGGMPQRTASAVQNKLDVVAEQTAGSTAMGQSTMTESNTEMDTLQTDPSRLGAAQSHRTDASRARPGLSTVTDAARDGGALGSAFGHATSTSHSVQDTDDVTSGTALVSAGVPGGYRGIDPPASSARPDSSRHNINNNPVPESQGSDAPNSGPYPRRQPMSPQQLAAQQNNALGYPNVAPSSGPSTNQERSSDDLLKLLNEQLNMLQSSNDGVVLGRIRMSGLTSRRVGGQGVIQHAQGLYNNTALSIKLCTSYDTFDLETAIYTNPVLSAIVPRVALVHDNLDNSFVDTKGMPMPPLIVLERGEPFDDWVKRTEPPLLALAKVLSQIAQQLAELHAAGYVHRDLKPANIMWLPQEERWALFDFGCAAASGRPAPLRFSLAYAAPEVVMNARDPDCDGTMHVVPSLDAWSLGVMAYEALMGERAFGSSTRTRSEVIRMLVGDDRLPWDLERPARLDARLGPMREPLLELLMRDPVQRPTMQQLADRFRIIANRQ